MSSAAVRILSDQGPSLEGRLHRPAQHARGAVLLCHPHPALGGSLDAPLIRALADGLAGAGLLALRFNFRGLGASEGQPTGGLVEHQDVAAALLWLARESATLPHLVGYSFGAAMALRALVEGSRAASLCCIGLPSVMIDESWLRLDRLESFAREPEGPPLLFLSGAEDQFCRPAWISEHLAGPRSQLEILQGAGHFFVGEEERRGMGRVVEWVSGLLANRPCSCRDARGGRRRAGRQHQRLQKE